MFAEHCYTTDASITTFRSALCNDLVDLEVRMFKIIAKFATENMGKKAVFKCGQVKNFYIAWRGVLRKTNIWKTEVQARLLSSNNAFLHVQVVQSR